MSSLERCPHCGAPIPVPSGGVVAIASVVSHVLGVDMDLVLAPSYTTRSRVANVAHARQLVAWLVSTRLGWSSVEIGRALGGRDHTTILTAIAAIRAQLRDDRDYADLVVAIEAELDRRNVARRHAA